jgi:hypothetical protein
LVQGPNSLNGMLTISATSIVRVEAPERQRFNRGRRLHEQRPDRLSSTSGVGGGERPATLAVSAGTWSTPRVPASPPSTGLAAACFQCGIDNRSTLTLVDTGLTREAPGAHVNSGTINVSGGDADAEVGHDADVHQQRAIAIANGRTVRQRRLLRARRWHHQRAGTLAYRAP